MKKFFTFIILCILSSNVIHAGIRWTLSGDGTLTISGTDMPDYTSSPWYSQREKIKQVVIKNGVTNIGASSFLECYNIQSIAIPNSVTNIGNNAFSGCSGLTSVTIPNSVTGIGSFAFKNCSGLTSVTIPNNVTSINSTAFDGCSGMTSVTIPNSVTSIGAGAFSGTAWYNNQPNGLVYAGNFAAYSRKRTRHIAQLSRTNLHLKEKYSKT